MNTHHKDKSVSKSISLYESEWAAIDQAISEHRYPSKGALLRAALIKALPNMFPDKHQTHPLPDTQTPATSAATQTLAQLEARIIRFERIMDQLQAIDPQIAQAMQVAEDQAPYPDKP